ncbi:ligand-binding protein SH3 [Methanosarcina sp. 2.H.T.1A.6]|uniref:COG2426 family protein n=1 Tax=unclassified Methanosarcina TaxID=2644672 RepID=UPI0006216D0B|nr:MULTISPECIES: small multi-drug export protein [unclassified Methanosarcina]KKG14748.1 ligand-binding protein SH3 [Methanosarcina sp. 2.H.T.1A.3]KKG23880.1 ligand-binding protein SH3 [Methanosarcina sp. 2.H.T.1A.6]KKG24177.1 ligand-binding protein SH3 [Methanosarcina sp. 2.H.T.1A.15]KKG26482.1 ligand-binding protein SH3 [Methanosarcina sp. 2.H.T.1A.8]
MSVENLLVEMLGSVPHWLAVMVIGALPISELRGAIPVAMGIYGMGPLEAYVLSVLGNLIPVVPLLLFLEPVSGYLRRYHIFDVFFTWLFSRTRRNHTENFEKYGLLALTLFVAVPLPVTGAWTGCAAAFVFGIKFKHSLPAIAAGVMIAGAIVTILTMTGMGLADLIFGV